jgi:hypothetical protein
MRDKMKKVLLGTSAIALAGAFASQASANEWTVRVGGYMEQYAAYADVDVDNGNTAEGIPTGADLNGIDSKQDAEIHFLPSITLDNGLLIGADIQLEGNTSGDQIDESFMRIKGSFGEINLGNENSAGYKMMYAAPDVTFVNVNSGSLSAWVPFTGAGLAAATNGTDFGNDVFRGTLGASFIETLGNNDIARFTYYTPRFAGFQVGVSYARDNTQDSNAALDCDNNACDFFDVGANYVNSFGAFNLALAGRYGWADTPSGGSPEVWAAGLNLGYGGFTIGGSYADQDGDHGAAEGRYWDAGVSYETGPWGFSFTYANGENVNDECFFADGVDACGSSTDEEELQQFLLGLNYALAKGVNLNAFGAYVDFEEDGPNEEMDGWVLGTGIKIAF